MDVDLAMHELDVPTLKSVKDYCTCMDFTLSRKPFATHFLNEGEKVKFGKVS